MENSRVTGPNQKKKKKNTRKAERKEPKNPVNLDRNE